MRPQSIALLGAGLALLPASPAAAGTLTTPNSCRWSDGFFRHLDITLSGVGSPSPVAPGSGLKLTQASVHVRLPDYLAQAGYGLGILNAGRNEFDVRAWIAIAAPGTSQGSTVVPVETVAATDIAVDASGAYQSSTPIAVTVPLPETTWSAGSAPVAFRQAGAGALPPVPAGGGGASVTPIGSAYISAQPRGGSLRLNIDCQPGTGEGKDAPAPVAAGAFETVPVDAAAPVVIPAPAAKRPALSLRTSKLKLTGRRVGVALACTDAPCKGTLTAKFAGGTAAKSVRYELPADGRRTYKLVLSAKARNALAKHSLLISLKATTGGGKTVSKKLRLRK